MPLIVVEALGLVMTSISRIKMALLLCTVLLWAFRHTRSVLKR